MRVHQEHHPRGFPTALRAFRWLWRFGTASSFANSGGRLRIEVYLRRVTSTLTLGRALFKFRSVTPLPVIGLLLWLLWRSRGAAGPGGILLDAALDGVGLTSCLFGEAIRFSVTGWVLDGTSGQNNRLEAVVLNTRGPYAWVRNPLYVGNLFLVLGLLLIANDPWVYAIGLAWSAKRDDARPR